MMRRITVGREGVVSGHRCVVYGGDCRLLTVAGSLPAAPSEALKVKESGPL